MTTSAGNISADAGYQPDARKTTGNELVAFRIGNQEYCVDIMIIREIRGWTPATPLPHAPPYVRGLINLRGTVLPVIDLAVRFGFEQREPSARSVIIVAEVGGQLVGLLVDAVSDILPISSETIQPTPDVSSELANKFVKGVLAIDNRMISLIQPDGILPNSTQAAVV